MTGSCMSPGGDVGPEPPPLGSLFSSAMEFPFLCGRVGAYGALARPRRYHGSPKRDKFVFIALPARRPIKHDLGALVENPGPCWTRERSRIRLIVYGASGAKSVFRSGARRNGAGEGLKCKVN